MTRMLMAAALAALLIAPRARAQGESMVGVGSAAPAAVAQTLDGKDFDLGTLIGKGPLVIEFWAVWCPNCKELEPQWLSLVKQYQGTVTFVGVAVSVNESAARVQKYAQQHGFTHLVLFDTHGTATGAFDVPATSYVVVIDRKGKIVYTGVGGDQDLAAAIRKAL